MSIFINCYLHFIYMVKGDQIRNVKKFFKNHSDYICFNSKQLDKGIFECSNFDISHATYYNYKRVILSFCDDIDNNGNYKIDWSRVYLHLKVKQKKEGLTKDV